MCVELKIDVLKDKGLTEEQITMIKALFPFYHNHMKEVVISNLPELDSSDEEEDGKSDDS
jgi:hypothetical protein